MDGTSNSLGDLSTHFSKWEFKCPCRKCIRRKVKVSRVLLHRLEMMIMIIDKGLDFHKPVIVLSGNRCKEYNERVHGYPNSAHITGDAADIKVEGITPLKLGLIAEKVGGLRIGIAKWGIHVDVMPPNPSKYWIYKHDIIYSAKIENESLLKFYQIVKEGG